MARAGDVVRLDVLRAGKTQTLQVRSGVRPSEKELNAQNGDRDEEATPPSAPGASAAQVLGLNVAPLDPAARQRFHIPQASNGVLITGTVPHTEAAKKGFRAGDLIIMADNRQVTSVAQLQQVVAAVKSSGRPSVLLLVQRDGRNIPVVLPFAPAGK
jgi:serine protease Do